MTAHSPYQADPGPAPVLTSPPPILVAVAEPRPQRRVTVAFRLLLAVPHLFLLYWLNFAAGFVLFVGWWGALFTGRLPGFAVTYLSGVLRWATRVHAYDSLLTDVYPPFTLDDDPSYPVRIAIPEPQRLNRAAVFFRYFLAIPAGIVGFVVLYGAGTLMAFIAWLIALVAGQLPPSFYLAYAAVVRFQTRYAGYWWMLTPAYPGGLYGDKPGAMAWAAQLPPAQAPGFGTPAPGFGTPGFAAPEQAYGNPDAVYGNPVDDVPQGYGSAAGYDAPAGYGAPAPAPYGAPAGYGVQPVFQPGTWLLPLTSAARSLMTVFIVLGSLFLVGVVASYAVIIGSAVNSADNTANAITANNQLVTSYNTLSDKLTTLSQASNGCNQNLTCVTKDDAQAADAFGAFSAQLASTSVPASAAADKARLAAAAATAQQDYTRLSKATTVSQYQATLASDGAGLQRSLNSFDADFNALTTNLQTNS